MQPTRWGNALFLLKASGLQLKRCARDAGRGPAALGQLSSELSAAPVAGRSVSRLWTSADEAEFALQAGKIENLRIALRRLHGREFAPGARFSFWRQLGRPTRVKGYVAGREIREGCIIPSVAGGLCQLSNGLYDAALAAGFLILERHAHSRIVPGSLAEQGRDATVFWNYVDLQFSAPAGFRIEAELTGEELIVRLRAPRVEPAAAAAPGGKADGQAAFLPAASCETCGVHSCVRHVAWHQRPRAGRATRALLVDACWPEFDGFLRAAREPGDVLFVPLDGRRWGKAQYAWDVGGVAQLEQGVLPTLRRARSLRALAAQGAARQRAMLAADEALALSYGRRLTPAMTHLVISHNLLLPLWRAGLLGGRTFDVLMTRPPLSLLQAQLDLAAQRHPQSPSLADFRVPAAVAATEDAALARARVLVTPHAWLAARLGARGHLLAWQRPAAPVPLGPPVPAGRLLFPGPSAGRKGAYELREVALRLGLRLRLLGSELEGDGFWAGVDCERLPRGTSWIDALRGVAAVVLPAYVEAAPRLLLLALAHGVPVVASAACGLAPAPGLTLLADVDAGSLSAALGQGKVSRRGG